MHDSNARLTIHCQRCRNADVRMTVCVVGGSVYWIDYPNRTRKIDVTFDRDLFAEKPVVRKLGYQMLTNHLVRTQIRPRDEFGSLLLTHLIRPLSGPRHDEFASSRHGRDGFV